MLAPIAFTLYRVSAGGLDDSIELLFRPLVGELIINMLAITVSATLVCALVGTAAWFVERTHLPARRLWAMLCAAPLAMPAFVSSYAWASISLELQDFAGRCWSSRRRILHGVSACRGGIARDALARGESRETKLIR